MTLASGKPSHPVWADLESTSPIMLQNRTIEHLRELSMDLPSKDNQRIGPTYDNLIIELIQNYRKKKKLWDPILNDNDDG